MACPNCGSHELWDDELAWGCRKCGFMTMGAVRNVLSPRDVFNRGQAGHEWRGGGGRSEEAGTARTRSWYDRLPDKRRDT